MSNRKQFHPRLVEALSPVPYSPLFGILWPIIGEQACFQTRDLLREVHPYFKALCLPHERSDYAKRNYLNRPGYKANIPLVLDLSLGVEWRSWGADKCAFSSVAAFRAFCAIGDVDPDQGRSWDPYPSSGGTASPYPMHVWLSRTKDIVFESLENPLEDGNCHYFGLTGVADKAIAMYNFMHDNHYHYSEQAGGDPEMTTIWDVMEWGRSYI